MRVLFTDLNNKKNNKEYRTTAKELTLSAVVRIFRVNVPVIETSAEAIVQSGKWIGKTEWQSPSGQYFIEIVSDD